MEETLNDPKQCFKWSLLLSISMCIHHSSSGKAITQCPSNATTWISAQITVWKSCHNRAQRKAAMLQKWRVKPVSELQVPGGWASLIPVLNRFSAFGLRSSVAYQPWLGFHLWLMDPLPSPERLYGHSLFSRSCWGIKEILGQLRYLTVQAWKWLCNSCYIKHTWNLLDNVVSHALRREVYGL